MNKSYRNLTKKFLIGTSIAMGIVFMAGCAKDAKQDIKEQEVGGTRVVLRVGDIDYGKGGPALKGKAGQTASVSSANKIEILESDGFEVLVSQREKGGKSSKMIGSRRNSGGSTNGLRAEAMEEGFNYRIFIKEQGATTGFISEQFVSGETGSLPVEKGKIYEWYALSYNSTDEVPEGDENGQVTVIAGDGLLYAAGIFEVENADGDVVVPLTITFKPRLTRLVIELNTMGMFAPMAGADVSVSGLYVAPEAIDIVTGHFVGDTTENLSVAYEDFTDIAGAGGQRKVLTTSVAANAADGISVTVSGLQITLDDGSTRDFGTKAIVHQFTPEHGMEQEMLFGFIESALTTDRSGVEVQWARSNLYYESGEFNPYRFFHTNPFITASNTEDANKSFFSFRGHIPRQFASANEAQQLDPCALVYPAGRWKTPTDVELRSLTSTSGLIGDLLGDILSVVFPEPGTPGASFGSNYIEYVPSAGSDPAYGSATSATNRLRFPYNGLQTQLSAVSGLVTLSLGNVGETAALWSSDRVADLALIEVGAWGYLGATAPAQLGIPPRAARAIAGRSAGVLNLDVLNLGLLGSGFQNVRCTRNASWDPTAAGYDPNPDLSAL
ncbi:hypothetical protein [Sphingobacterium corticibacterium]|uniref:Fimbrillin family protein n=1 Tax=Sphingobacterium corticibacterium TaxID=2484746 RepID=A0A4Q6XNK5_9SPHI|nr:hypothetical protein [Sphingobacterium corticibacterium]RZF58874.1 hypothetical protein EWE74_16255 [Sphingobacterium corticibacterium]